MMPSGSTKLPQLRLDLQYTIHQQGDDRWYSVHDPLNGQFFRLGAREYMLASMFREGLSPEELLEQISCSDFQRMEADRPVTVGELSQLAAWLFRSGLCQSPQQAQTKSPYKAWILNPLSMRIPLVAGHHLERFSGWISPFLNPAVSCGIIVAYVVAIVCAMSNWTMFSEASGRLFVSDSHLWWLAAWLILKVAHEIGHAVMAVRVGSNIRAAGINIIFFAPIPYVDVSDLWTIANRWKRIACSAAGILTELLIASLATFVAIWTDSESIRYFCCALAITGTVTTLAFNANPLMRFDGYYILSDLLNIPNLWSQSQLAFSSLVKRLLLPWQAKALPSLGYAAYGGTSLVYRWMIMLTMAATAILVWNEIGVLLVIWAGYATYLNPWIKSYRREKMARQAAGTNVTWRERVWSITAIAGLILALTLIPSPIQPSAPGVVTFHDPVQVNAGSQGILQELAVRVGNSVKKGELIAVLTDSNLTLELRKKQLEAQSVQESLRAQQARGNLAELQASQARLESLQTQLSQLELKVRRLEIRAPQDGTVVHLSVNNCLGRNVDAGESICLLAPTQELQARVSASQRDLAAFHKAVGQSVSIHHIGSTPRSGTIAKVDLKGNQFLDDPLLAGCHNGPIPVEMDSEATAKEGQWKLLAPRFDVHVRLPTSAEFVPGQLVWVKIPGESASIASVIGSWFRHHWETLRNQVDG